MTHCSCLASRQVYLLPINLQGTIAMPFWRSQNTQKGNGWTSTLVPWENDLAYLDWKVILNNKAANVTIEELHVHLNHLPFPAIWQLIRTQAIEGVPNHVMGDTRKDDFCEECVNGKLTRALHTKPTTQAEQPLLWIYSDVHSPIPIHSWQGHMYWVTFIDNFSHFPAIYFIAKKSDIFGAFCQYKVWAENVTGQQIGILRDDKGSEYMSSESNHFLSEAGIWREHSVHDTPQQLGVAECMNRSLAEGITTALLCR